MKKAIAEIKTAKKTIADQAKRISELEESLTVAHMLGYQKAKEESRARLSGLEASTKADESRLIAAAEKARITYFGCDTPDHLADRILELESEIKLLADRAAHNARQDAAAAEIQAGRIKGLEERARQIAERESGDFVNSRGEHMYQQIDPATRVGLAREQLRSEGKI